MQKLNKEAKQRIEKLQEIDSSINENGKSTLEHHDEVKVEQRNMKKHRFPCSHRSLLIQVSSDLENKYLEI